VIEAEITCECPSIQLADLQVALTKGMVVYLEATSARQSADLRRAMVAKGVTVKYVQRFRERRPEPVVVQLPPVAPSPVRQVPRPEPEGLDEMGLAQRVADLLSPQIQGMLEQVVAEIQLLRVQGVARVQEVGRERTSGTMVVDEVPVFIPSKIGRDDLRPIIEVKATEGDAGGVSDAVAALKAARKSKAS